MRAAAAVILLAVLATGCAHEPAAPVVKYVKVMPDETRAIVAASIYGYEINMNRPCPCPYSKGGTCKGQSAYERAGGARPRCYTSDVSTADLKRWRELMKSVPTEPK